MNRSTALALVLASVLPAGCCGHAAATAAEPPPPSGPHGRVVRGEYLFTLAPGADAKVLEAALAELAPKGIQDLGGGVFLVTFAEDPGLPRLEALRAKEARIRAVQPNYVYRALPR